MKVRERMTRDVITVNRETSITEAFRLMEKNKIRRLPVMDGDKLIGIVTLSDLNRAAPSSATSLSVHELNYLLAKTKIKDIIPKKQEILTVRPENYIETAAQIMRQNVVSGLPVVDLNNKLVGIITETDIFDALIDILGVKKPHSRIDIYVNDRRGGLAEVAGLVAKKNINILNTVLYYDQQRKKYKIILRLEGLKCGPILEELKERGYEIESVIIRESGDG